MMMDNSEFMRNGDYSPSRLDVMLDAVNLVYKTKTQHRESSIGLMTMAGEKPDVLMTLSAEVKEMHRYIKAVSLAGKIDLLHSMQKAQLALKHRQNKNQRMRVVVFVASPICDPADSEAVEKALVKQAKKMKKTNISVDIVNFGETAANTPILEAFVQAVNKDSKSHLVNVPPGPHILSDILCASAIIRGEGSGEGGNGGGGGGGNFGADMIDGVDPALDPELALALRVSLEESRAAEEAAARAQAGNEVGADAADATSSKEAPVTDQEAKPMDLEDELLQQAIALSNENDGHDGTAAAAVLPAAGEAMSDDQALQLAIELSMKEDADAEAAMQVDTKEDEDMVAVLGTLPGVDTTDPGLEDAVKEMEKKD